MEFKERGKGKENGKASIISHNIICDVYWKLLKKQGVGGKRVKGREIERVE
jgi:hypothetical protein